MSKDDEDYFLLGKVEVRQRHDQMNNPACAEVLDWRSGERV
jgi:hypothetical protein